MSIMPVRQRLTPRLGYPAAPQGRVKAVRRFKALQTIADLPEQGLAHCESSNLLKVLSGNDWLRQASLTPIPKKLFGDLWYEGELCILFADTNLGKSILAVQIAESISSGISIQGLPLEAPAQTVLYLDFELSQKQFEVRYSADYKNHYIFSPQFFRAEINPDHMIPEGNSTFEEFLYQSLEEVIKRTGAKVIVIDNLTYLKNETERAKDALPLMKHLKALKRKYNLSILALAHTPKRDLSKPITRNDLQGSKMLINFCDSAFAIGENCHDSGIRYLKQIKARNTEILYDAENVYLCQISKPFNFLKFDLLTTASEASMLRQQSESDKKTKIEEVLKLKEQGMTNVAIGQQLGISEGTVRKWLRKREEGSDL